MKSSRLVMNLSLQHTTTSQNLNQLAELGFTHREDGWVLGPHVSELPQIEICAQEQWVEINDLREKLKVNAELQKRLQRYPGISEAPPGPLVTSQVIIFQC